MRRLVVGVVLGWLALTLAAGAEKRPAAAADARVGVVTREFTPKQMRNWRGAEGKTLHCVIWYPAVDTAIETRQLIGPPDAPLFEAGSATPHAPFAPALGKWSLILLSHGTGGNAMQMAWLGTALARAGFIAVAVDHPGNNSATDAPLTPEGMALWWERATDLSNVLDGMLADEEFGAKIDPRLVAAAGFSLGGYTALELAGARTDISALFDLCRKNDDNAVCNVPETRGMGTPDEILQKVRKTSGESLARSGESFRDPRIQAVFAIAPALGFTQTPESLHSIRIPVEVVVGADDPIAPPEQNASYVRSNIRGARETILPNVTHYTFLDTCTAEGVKKLPLYCGDSARRDAVHAQVAGMAVQFFYRALKLK
jgi:predicted dienelactone hydrolase